MLAASGISFAAWFIGAIFLMDNVHHNFFLWMLLIFLLLMLMLLGLILWGGFKMKLLSIPVCSMIALSLVVTLVFHSWTVIQENIPTVGESGDLLSQYSPFEESKVAELEKPATLQLSGLDLPKLDGATAMYPIYSAFFKAVYTDHYESHITCSTTTKAYDNIITGEADIIFVGGPSEDQKKAAEEAGVELVYTPIGREAFVFFVNSKNPINDITLEKIKGIYSGEITEWNELDVEKLGKIRAFQRDEGSGSQTALQTLMGDMPLMDPPREDRIDGMGGIISQTADYKNYKNAIGYSFRFYSTEMVQNDQIKLLSVNGIAPTLENIENGTYPIASEFYAVTRSDADENTKAFVDWILSAEGQALIEKTGYTPLNK
ncbi:MAG: substrate-binding domain-containing protein [Clostridia bacterium]|nr:substrate-binding domain-containing protein [Clostridia bacterium]